MGLSVAHKLMTDHLADGTMTPGEEIGLRIDQTLTQDATGTMVMLELEGMGLDRTKAEVSAQYVDHNLIQADHRNPDDHLFLQSACARFGIWYSRPGNGVSHPVHQERFGKPGKTLVGSDSHTPAAGAIGMLAFGAGGIEVALAIAGEPLYLSMPAIWGVRLEGALPDWVSAKDVILELLRRHGVAGGRGRIIEYHGPGVECLSTMDRHVLANMGTELGATSTVFPADDEVQRFLRRQGRDADFAPLAADADAAYDVEDTIDLSTLEPLIAMPSSPGNVVPVREVAGSTIYQAYIGSSANPGFRDFAVAAEIVGDQSVHPRVSFDVNPTSRQILQNLIAEGHLAALIAAGARVHQAGCNGCIGMGQAPATDRLSLRTVPRNFPGRSGSRDDRVCLVSPETAAASALAGVITDPRELDMEYPHIREPEHPILNTSMLVPPGSDGRETELVKGPNIAPLPEFDDLPDDFDLPIILKIGDDLSTDEIMPAGARILPFRSNIPRISSFCFENVEANYRDQAQAAHSHAIVAGHNYGQGSSREHAAVAPRYLGLRLVLAKSFARIHWQNLVNFGVLPLEFEEEDAYERIARGHTLRLRNLHTQLQRENHRVTIEHIETGEAIRARHRLSSRQRDMLLAGSVINLQRGRVQN